MDSRARIWWCVPPHLYGEESQNTGPCAYIQHDFILKILLVVDEGILVGPWAGRQAGRHDAEQQRGRAAE